MPLGSMVTGLEAIFTLIKHSKNILRYKEENHVSKNLH